MSSQIVLPSELCITLVTFMLVHFQVHVNHVQSQCLIILKVLPHSQQSTFFLGLLYSLHQNDTPNPWDYQTFFNTDHNYESNSRVSVGDARHR